MLGYRHYALGTPSPLPTPVFIGLWRPSPPAPPRSFRPLAAPRPRALSRPSPPLPHPSPPLRWLALRGTLQGRSLVRSCAQVSFATGLPTAPMLIQEARFSLPCLDTITGCAQCLSYACNPPLPHFAHSSPPRAPHRRPQTKRRGEPPPSHTHPGL